METNYDEYHKGENIIISGIVEPIILDTPITIRVINNESIIYVAQINVAQDGSFVDNIKAKGQSWKNNGTYVINAVYGNISTEKNIKFIKGTDEILKDFINVNIQNNNFQIPYVIKNGDIIKINAEYTNISLIVMIESYDNGYLQLELPRNLIDSKKYNNNQDDVFIVLINGEEVEFEETTTLENRILMIPFSEDTEEIEIIGTYVVPEFGSIAVLILAIAIVSLVAITSKTKLNILR